MTIKSAARASVAAALLFANLAAAHAQDAIPAKAKAELDAAWGAAKRVAVRGPGVVKLLDQASVQLAPEEVFIPAAAANRVMAAMGNSISPGRQGLIVSTRKDASWMVDIDWTKEGYVRDGEAKDWQADALLENLKEGTEHDNAAREAQGIPPLDITGWVEKPAYDQSTHRLVWSLAAHERGAPGNAPQTVNYNTYALGREGYFSLDLLTDSAAVSGDKQVARALLGTLQFAPGKRYEEFNASTDKVAAYGIAALVGAVAVKKLGLLAMAGVFLLKVWKLGLVAAVAIGSGMRRFFGGRGEPPAEA